MTTIIDLGKLRFQFRNDWDDETIYEPNDVVRYGAALFVYIYPVKDFGFVPTDTKYWSRMADGIRWRGNYSDTFVYRPGDAVTYGGSVYIALDEFSGILPLTNPSAWTVFVPGVNPRGAFNAIENYLPGDLVSFANTIYICTAPSLGAAPTDLTKWQPYVSSVIAGDFFRTRSSALVSGGLLRAYAADVSGTALGTVSPVSNTAYFVPFTVSAPTTISQISIEITAAGGNTNALAIYASANNLPSTVLAAGAAFTPSATGFTGASVNITLMPGVLYFLAYANTGAGGPTVRSVPVASIFPHFGRNGVNSVAALTIGTNTATAAGAFVAIPAGQTFSPLSGAIPAISYQVL